MFDNKSNEQVKMYEEETRVESETGFNYYLKQKWKLCVTLFCLFSFITMGIHLEISGSTMLPLSLQIGINLSQLSWIVAARSIGYMITILLFGLFFQSITKSHPELILAIGYLFPAAATALTPHLKSLWTLCLALLCQGMLHGISDLTINTLVTEMWSSHSTAPLNCVYFGYAVGALLSLVIVRSFRSNGSLIEKYSNSTIITKEGQFQSELVGPYTIASVFCLISAIGFGLIAYKQNKSKKKRKVCGSQSVAKKELNIKRLFNKGKFWKRCSPTTCGQGYFTYGFTLISLLLLYNFFFGGIEQGFTKFFISFVERDTLINKKDSVNTMIFYWLPMLFGRILSMFLTASWIRPHLMLFMSLVLCLLTYFFWLLFLWYIGLTRSSIFILVTLNGLSICSISPTTIGWVKQFLSLSPIELSLLLSSNALGGMGFGVICGYVFEHYNPKHLFTVVAFAVLSTYILFLLTFLIQRIHSKKEKKMKTEEPISQEDKTLETFLKDELQDERLSSDHFQTPTYIIEQ